MNDFWRALQPVFSLVPLSVKLLIALAIFLISVGVDQCVNAQPTPEQIQRFREMRGRRGGPRMRQPPPQAQPQPEAEEKKEEKKDYKKDEEKKEEEIKTFKRPTDGSVRLDPNRVRLQPDKNGMVQFNYNGQPWVDVLQEFADAAKMTFDYQELPADQLNLITQKKYNLKQARDLLNSRLLARGFTLVTQGELLSAVKVDKLDPSLVPRIEVDDLEDYMAHDIVRVRFDLPDSIEPAKAKDEVKVLLSPNAKITPLLSTKRLLVIDTVNNLTSVRDLFYAEQTAADSVMKPEIYQIKHRRADYVADQIMIVLGLDPAARKSPQELQLETQRMQLLMQMSQQKKDVSKLLKPGGPPVHIAVDRQQNVLMINAPEDLKRTIERTIEQCDQPAGGYVAATAGGRSTRPHKTKTASTDAVVSALTEFGQLDPLTRLQSDPKTKTIFAYATEADHQKIEEMVQKIDSTGREIHVIQLRRYSATGVAGTLTAMFAKPEDDEDKGRSRRSSFYYWGRGRDEEEEEDNELGFKAMPDVENNRLIIWANADELARVNKMLTRLGESPEGITRNPTKVRELPSRSPEETARLLEKLKAAYPGQLNIDDSELKKNLKQDKPEVKLEDKVTRRSPLGSARFMTVQQASDAAEESKTQTTPNPPINITVTEDGRIVLSSEDAAALNQLEELMGAISPPRTEFAKFKLEHVYAWRVADNLEEYFADELKGQTESVFDQWGEYEGKREKDLGPSTLGRRDLLRFVVDDHTNTVIVQGASRTQMKVIKQLIEIYDEKPEPEEFLSRKTEVIKLKYSQASDIASSIKDVYRELLSSKDKEFKDEEGGSSILSNERTYVFGQTKIDENGEPDPVFIQFDGMLAVGTDPISNALIISAREEVLESVKETVRLLDEAARPDTTIHVHRVGSGVRAGTLQELLKQSLSSPWPGGKPQQARSQTQQKQGEEQTREQPRERESEGRRRRRR